MSSVPDPGNITDVPKAEAQLTIWKAAAYGELDNLQVRKQRQPLFNTMYLGLLRWTR